MKEDNIIQQKTFEFSLNLYPLVKALEKQKEFIISKQLFRSGTSVGANVEEALGGQSRKDFLAKLGIAYKEARETHYWLRLVKALELQDTSKLLADNEEVLRILGSIQKTTKNNS